MTCQACGQPLPRPEPVPCPARDRGERCRCGHESMAHTPDGVCMTCITDRPIERKTPT